MNGPDSIEKNCFFPDVLLGAMGETQFTRKSLDYRY